MSSGTNSAYQLVSLSYIQISPIDFGQGWRLKLHTFGRATLASMTL